MQRDILASVKAGRNTFITGHAGTGKTVTLRAIIDALPKDSTVVAAPTGVAALNVGGTTLHALFGLRPGDELDSFLIRRRAIKLEQTALAMRGLKTLVIDEVSMVSPQLFDAIDIICKTLKLSFSPFGGVQIVACGDFLQLPPIQDPQQVATDAMLRLLDAQQAAVLAAAASTDMPCAASAAAAAVTTTPAGAPPSPKTVSVAAAATSTTPKYCFQTRSWAEANFARFDLAHSFRQEGDAAFIAFLNAARVGRTNVSYMLRNLATTAERQATESAARTQRLIAAQQQQQQQRKQQQSPSTAAAASATATTSAADAIKVVQIRATNKEVDEINQAGYAVVTAQNKAARSLQALSPDAPPHTAADFTTRFRAQATGSMAHRLRESNVMAELDLQRGTSVMLLRNVDIAAGLVNGRLGTVVAFEPISMLDVGGTCNLSLAQILRVAPHGVLPLVEFEGVGRVMVFPQVWESRSGKTVDGTLHQLPLRQAWAITAHKSQGLTLDKVEVDLLNFFEAGQGYVALSRARSAAGLRVLNAHRAHNVINACPIALEFQTRHDGNPQQQRRPPSPRKSATAVAAAASASRKPSPERKSSKS